MEEVKEIIVSTDYSKIKKVVFKYPFMVNENAENIIKDKHNAIEFTKNQLSKFRQKVLDIEQELKVLQEEFRDITRDCHIEYETYNKEHTTRKSSLFISGQGNDTLGRFGN